MLVSLGLKPRNFKELPTVSEREAVKDDSLGLQPQVWAAKKYIQVE